MVTLVSAADARDCVMGDGESAFLDVREAGQFGEAHALLATPLAYSELETRVRAMVPRLSTPCVVIDAGDGISQRAAARLEDLGYSDVRILDGGMPAWKDAGFTVYKGVNVPSKVFGELVEHDFHTESIDAEDLHAMQARGEDLVVLDGRTPEEFNRMSIPQGISCPNAELGLRLEALLPSKDSLVVVNCAGRTRSIMGAQSLVELGVSNRVVALRNGTMGWRLAGYELESESPKTFPSELSQAQLQLGRDRGEALCAKHKLRRVDAQTVKSWFMDHERTVSLLDVRTAKEFDEHHLAGAQHAPGGQLVQATDQWVAVRGARIVLADSHLVRAAISAVWMRAMGHDVYIMDDLTDWPRDDVDLPGFDGMPEFDRVPCLGTDALKHALSKGAVIADIRASATYRKGHPSGAIWTIRPNLLDDLRGRSNVILLSDQDSIASLAARDLSEAGFEVVGAISNDSDVWAAAGVPSEKSPQSPPDSERIDYLFFVHDRHAGNMEAAQAYLDWETGLVDQLDDQERAIFASL